MRASVLVESSDTSEPGGPVELSSLVPEARLQVPPTTGELRSESPRCGWNRYIGAHDDGVCVYI